jgi:hypothetical protein
VFLTHFNYVCILVLSALRMATGVGQHVGDYCVMILLSYFQEHMLVLVKKIVLVTKILEKCDRKYLGVRC